MISWRNEEPDPPELDALVSLIIDEVKALREYQEIILNSRSSDRVHYTLLRRPLQLVKVLQEDKDADP